MDYMARLTSKGQITIPKEVRDGLGLKTGDTVLFRLHEKNAVIARVPSFLELGGSVPVPPSKRGLDWSVIRAEAWGKATERHLRGTSKER